MRLELGLSVEGMANRLRISRTALYRYERGEAPKLATLERAAILLGVPLAALLGGGLEWFGTALGFFERLRQVEAEADHLFVLFGPTSWLLVSDGYAEFIEGMIRSALQPADAAALIHVMRERRAVYRQRRPSLVSLLSLHDMDAGGTAQAVPPGGDAAKMRALIRSEWTNVASLAEAPPRGVQLGVLRERIPTTGFSLARNATGTTLGISPFRFGDPMNLRIGAASITREANAVRIHEAMADELWSVALKGAEAAALIRWQLKRRRGRAVTA